MKPPPPTERAVQRSILAMVKLRFPDVFVAHIPNGAHLFGDDRTRAMQMGALKGDGLRKGMPDLAAYWNHGHALIEVKRPGGKLSPDQEELHALFAAMGHKPAVCTSQAEAYLFLRERGAPCRIPWADAA